MKRGSELMKLIPVTIEKYAHMGRVESADFLVVVGGEYVVLHSPLHNMN